jgi:hypothetical protein
VRNLHRHLAAGMPEPGKGEGIELWTKRAKEWLEANQKPPGPKGRKKTAERDRLELRILKAKAGMAELELQQQRGEMLSRAEVEAEQLRQHQAVARAFDRLGDVLARTLYQAPSPDFIKATIDEEVKRCKAALRDAEARRADDKPVAKRVRGTA